MSSIILVCGIIAALKSTIAKQLSKDLGIPSFHKDMIKERLVDVIGYTTREENLKLSEASFVMLQEIAQRTLEANVDVILESNFKPHELAQLSRIPGWDEAKVLSIYCYASPKVLYERYAARLKSRHIAHQSVGELSLAQFERIVEEYRGMDLPGTVWLQSTETYTEEDYQKTLAQVRNFLSST